jgi:hypothetical protein
MRQAPRYVSSSGVSAGPVEDTSGIYNSYVDIFDGIQKATMPIAKSIAFEQAKEQGEIAGENPGFKTAPSIGVASRAFNQAGLAANKMAITTDAAQQLQSFRNNALGINPDGSRIPGHDGITPTSIREYNADVAGFAEGQFKTIPAENRSYFKHMLAMKSTVDQTHLQTLLKKKQDRIGAVELSDANQTNNLQINELLSQGGVVSDEAAKQLLGVQTDNINKLMASGAITPTYAQSLKKANNKNFITYNHISNYNHLLSTDPEEAGKYLDRVQLDPTVNTMLGTRGANALHSEMKGMAEARLRAEGATAQQMSQMSATLVDAAYNGKPIDQAMNQRVHEYNVVHNRGGNNEILETNIQGAQYAGSLARQADTIPLSQAKEHQDSIDLLISSIKGTNPGDQHYKQQLTTASKDFRKKILARQTDAQSWVEQTAQYRNMQVKVASDPKNYSQKDLDGLSLNLQRLDGHDESTFKLLSNKDANTWSKRFRGAGQEETINIINSLKERYGVNLPVVLSNIDSVKGFNEQLSSIYTLANNPETSADVADVMQSMNSKPSQFSNHLTNINKGSSLSNKVSMASIKESIRKEAAPSIDAYTSQGLYRTNEVDQTLTTAAHYLLYSNEKSNKNAISDSEYKNAADLFFNHHQTTSSFNGKTYAIPRTDVMGTNIDPSIVRAAMNIKGQKVLDPNSQLEIPKDIIDRYGEHVGAERYRIDLETNMHFLNNGKQGYMAFDGHGNPVRFHDTLRKGPEIGQFVSRPLTIDFSEVTNPGSDLNNEINNETSKIMAKSSFKLEGKKFDFTRDKAISDIIERPLRAPEDDVAHLRSAVEFKKLKLSIKDDLMKFLGIGILDF